VEGCEHVTQLLGVSLTGIQLGLPGHLDELETGSKSCFEYGDGDGGNEIISSSDPRVSMMMWMTHQSPILSLLCFIDHLNAGRFISSGMWWFH